MQRALAALCLLAACAGDPPEAQPATGPGSSSGSGGTAPASTSATEEGLPGPIDVCVETAAGLEAHTVTSSRAGTYDPSAPIDGALLNWFVAGSYCVGYPGAATRRAVCGERADDAPVVARVLCQQ